MGITRLSTTLLSRLKGDLRNGELSSTISFFSEVEVAKDLDVVKAHKLLLIPEYPEQVYQAYLSCAKRLLSDPDLINREANYIEFLKIYILAIRRYEIQLKTILKIYLNKSLKEFVFQLFGSINEYLDQLFSIFYKNLETGTIDTSTPESKSEFHEWAHNQLRGVIVDVMFAVARLVNFYSEHQLEEISPIIFNSYSDQEREQMGKAIQVAAFMNTYLYALEKVSYNEWFVDRVENVGEVVNFRFGITDFNFQKARDLGLRRVLSGAMLGRKSKRWLAELLEPFALEILEVAWEYYQDQMGIFIAGHLKWHQAKEALSKYLDQLDAEDELLFGFHMKNKLVVSHYFSALAITVFVFAAEELEKYSNRSYWLTCPEIPEEIINNLVNNTRFEDYFLTSQISDYITKIPSRGHMEVFKLPFLRDHENKIYALRFIALNSWPKFIRSTLMKGGKIAAEIGKTWEGYVAKTMRDNGWDKVIEGVKIRKNNELLTDIDIVAKRKDWLLLIQLKISYSEGVHTYDQWKIKQRLIEGVAQVKKAETNIRVNKSILSQHLSQDELAEIYVIQSVVMTNEHIFNGWKYEGVSVFSIDALMQLINGAQVKFTTSEKRVVEIKEYGKTASLSTDEMIGFIDVPLDWRVGMPNYQIKMHTEVLDACTLHFPLVESNDSKLFGYR